MAQAKNTERDNDQMRKLFATLTIFFLFVAPLAVEAANCPTEVEAAKEMLKKQTAKADEIQTPRALAGARTQVDQASRSKEDQASRAKEDQASRTKVDQASRSKEDQASRSKIDQASRSKEDQASRTKEDQASRSKEDQASRSKVDQASRSKEDQASRGQDAGTPRATAGAPQLSKARTLVNEADAACKVGDMTKAAAKAKAAMELLK